MSFTFEIRELNEINRDPAGHHRHWTVLRGDLVEGEVVRDTPILISADKGDEYAARVLGFDLKGQIGSGEMVRADKAAGPMGLITWMPALPKHAKVVRARECSEEEREAVLISMLSRDPSFFFHSIEGANRVCTDCARALRTVASQVRPLLIGLAERTSGSLSEMIREELSRSSRP